MSRLSEIYDYIDSLHRFLYNLNGITAVFW